jgi:iron complex transport system ATP-binding protein
MTPLLSLHEVRFRYDGPMGREALAGLSLAITQGTITAILGPNGAGKTTLLHTMLGRLQPTAGEVRFEGRPFADFSRRELSHRIGLVPQSEQAAFEFSVLDYVLLGRTPYLGLLEMPREEDYEAARAALDFVGIAHLSERTVTTLSGGERQMVTVARALAQRPRLLLLDEPTAHLDLGNRGRIIAMMQHLRAEGLTVVFTTHDPNIAALIADEVILMREGRVLHSGTRDAVLTSDRLEETYGVPVVVEQLGERLVVLASEEGSFTSPP